MLKGISKNPDDPRIKIELALFFERLSATENESTFQGIPSISRARTQFEQARAKMDNNVDVWLHSIWFERRQEAKLAQNSATFSMSSVLSTLVSEATKRFPDSGAIFAESVAVEPRASQITLVKANRERFRNDPFFCALVGKFGIIISIFFLLHLHFTFVIGCIGNKENWISAVHS